MDGQGHTVGLCLVQQMCALAAAATPSPRLHAHSHVYKLQVGCRPARRQASQHPLAFLYR
jgi:hypothetical protein